METQKTEIKYGVGLERDEYVRSQELAFATFQKHALSSRRIFSVVLMVMCVMMLVSEYRLLKTVVFDVAVLVGLMILSELWIMFDQPRQMRKAQKTAYDATLFSGHSFDGVITVTEESISKMTTDETTTISFSQCMAYVESEDMLLFCVRQGKSIVIPSRCLTAEDAEETKRLAFSVIPPMKRYIKEALIPKAEARLPAELPPVAEDDVLVEIPVVYTAGELRANLTDTALRGFVSKFPNKVLLAVFFAAIVYFGAEVPVFPVFLLSLLLLFLLAIVNVLIQSKRMIAVSDGDVCRVTLTLTDKGLRAVGVGKKVQHICVPWKYITRAVERPKEVEFFSEKNSIVTIPKRCIPDMDELRTVVDTYVM